MSLDTSVSLPSQQQSEYRVDYTRLRALARQAWSTQPGVFDDEYFIGTLVERFPGCSIATATDSIGRLHVTINPKSKQAVHFLQGLAGYDLWRAQSDPLYTLSLNNTLASLNQTIESYKDRE